VTLDILANDRTADWPSGVLSGIGSRRNRAESFDTVITVYRRSRTATECLSPPAQELVWCSHRWLVESYRRSGCGG
jgi:hypothetical protein